MMFSLSLSLISHQICYLSLISHQINFDGDGGCGDGFHGDGGERWVVVVGLTVTMTVG
ncbi:hypothetical protein HanRHA438_Chr07g0314041 [Helianthus annuus]|uniref:Transmembrane protein n=1 Tax=Helianthus annuus TaxID=4232 RepID=A0A251UBM3_HELAN|nr:hypothetical protein HanXRQr2_Chr07g0304171 [Helianthus annuus]KAJ0908760.1 hypothetical protein HanRHA438_Chr07g0314041 [Helianthus annuus]